MTTENEDKELRRLAPDSQGFGRSAFYGSGKIFFSSFIIVVLASLLISRVAAPQILKPSEKERRKSSYLESVAALISPAEFFGDRAKSASEAKSRHLFWASGIEGFGFSVNALASRDLLESAFPGYGNLLHGEDAFWRRYFKSEFGPASFLLTQSKLSQAGFRVAYSWTGCLQILEKFGADVVVMGSSEVYLALAPELLAKKLSASFKEQPKVLHCMTFGMPINAVEYTLKRISETKKAKPKIIIWGYSFWLAYSGSKILKSYEAEKKSEFSRYLRESDDAANTSTLMTTINTLKHRKLSDYFPESKWDKAMSISLGDVTAFFQRQPEESAKVSSPPEGRKTQESFDFSPEKLSLSEPEFQQFLDSVLNPSYGILSGITENDCQLSQAKASFELVVQEALKITPNVFVYVPPTTAHHRRAAPPCLESNVFKMLNESRKKLNFFFLEKKTLADFGLTNRDFIYPTMDSDRYRFDINHANFAGGMKIVGELTNWINTVLKGAAL